MKRLSSIRYVNAPTGASGLAASRSSGDVGSSGGILATGQSRYDNNDED